MHIERGSFPGMLLSQGRFQGLLMKPKAKEVPPGFPSLKTWEKAANFSYSPQGPWLYLCQTGKRDSCATWFVEQE